MAELGRKFIEPPPFDLNIAYESTDNVTPVIFLLSTGSDPARSFFEFAEHVGMRSRVDVVSLGQGQAATAQKLIDEAKLKGNWVLLQVPVVHCCCWARLVVYHVMSGCCGAAELSPGHELADRSGAHC